MRTQIQQAYQLLHKQRHDEAADIFAKIRDLPTDDVGEVVERGRLAMLLDENIYALHSFGKAVELQPDNVGFISLLANSYIKIGNMTFAIELSQRALEIDAEHYESLVVLGMGASKYGNYEEAVGFYEKAIKHKPGEVAPYRDMVICLRSVGRHDEALVYAKKLLRLDPRALNYIPISRVLIEQGNPDEAVSYLEMAIRKDASCGYAYHELASIKKYTDKDDALIKQAEKALRGSVPALERSLIHFSLGKAYNDRKEWGKAFENYKQGNLLDRVPVEPTWLPDRIKAAKQIYNKSFIQQDECVGSDSDVPVFIVGMPRSGTTLTEQIIASHPSGAGAGELSGIARAHAEICSGNEKTLKNLGKTLTKKMLSQHAVTYLEMLRSTRESAVRVVDKQPHNFSTLGLMYKLFPNAYFIHTVRHPLDTCLSCYFQAFSFVPQTYDLKWLGKTYRLYREAMQHWKSLLPENSILDVQYEHLVEDTETESRRIIDFCDLPWDDKCLEFYKASRPVITASLWQARQPIYTSSKGRWVNYARHLGPLVNEISDYLSDEDIAELEKHGVKIKKKWGFGFLKAGK